MVMLHEFGHYWTAKRAGMKVTEFFVGFGPRLWSFTRGETEYGVKAIPAGGYVRIIGMTNMEEVDPADEPRTFRQGTPGKRLTVILAGVTVNLIIAFLLIFVVIAGQGRVERRPQHHRQPGLGGQRRPRGRAADRRQDRRHQRRRDLRLGPAQVDDREEPRPADSTSPSSVTASRSRFPPPPSGRAARDSSGSRPASRSATSAWSEAVPETFKSMGSIFTGFTHVLGDRLSPSGVSTSASQSFTSAAPKAGSSQDLNRPMSLIGIVDTGSELIGNNIWLLLLLLGQISFILAVFNLLPILPFDGGHAVVVLYEWVASKVRHRRVYVDYRKLIPVSVVLLIPILFLGLSSMVLDIRHLGQ